MKRRQASSTHCGQFLKPAPAAGWWTPRVIRLVSRPKEPPFDQTLVIIEPVEIPL